MTTSPGNQQRHLIGAYVNPALVAAVDAFAHRHRISRSEALRLALERLVGQGPAFPALLREPQSTHTAAERAP